MTTLKTVLIGVAAIVMTGATLGPVALGFTGKAFAGETATDKSGAPVWQGEEIVVEAPRMDKDVVIVEAPRLKQKKSEDTKVATTRTENRSSVIVFLPQL